MIELRMPNHYEPLNSNDLMKYTGEGAVLTLALYKIATHAITHIEWYAAAYDVIDNFSTAVSTIKSWRQKNGTYSFKSRFVPGGNSNIYPPHSAQGATGYWTYYSEWVRK